MPNRIGQNNNGLDHEWSALTGRHDPPLKTVNVFRQEFSAAFQKRECEKNMPLETKDSMYCAWF
jgi:hypothetical protein